MAGLYSRQKNWNDGDVLTEADLEGEFDHIYDSIVAGTTTEVGMVQLEDSVTSTSITKAATPKSVKEAYDHAGGGSVSDTAYAASWNGVTDVAPSKNAVYDKIETLGGGGTVDTFGTPVDNDFAKFTDADTIEGRSKAEMLSDLNVVDGATKYPDTGEQAFLDADHTKLNGIETSATADQTKTDIDGLGLSHDSLSDVSANDHHAQSHNAASHSDIASSGTNIDSAVSLKHAATLIGTKTIDETDIANTKVIAYNSVSGNLEYESAGTPDAHASSHQNGGADEISVVGLSGLLADDQHVLDAEVKAAAVSDAVYAVGWNGVTDVAPSKNAVYDKIETLGGGGDVTAAANLTANVLVMGDDGAKGIKVASMATASFLGRNTAGAGIPEVLSKATALSLLNVEDGATADNISDANVTDLTDGFDTTLHDHDGISENTSARHTQGTDTGLGTLAADINMGTHKLTALSVPSAAGHSIRATASITEAALEDGITKKHAAGGDTDLDSTFEATFLKKAAYNTNTFLYAVNDDTPVVKTRAETLALLSGQASASFDMNSQAITKLSNVVTTHTPGAAGTATLDLDVSRIHDITMPAGNITIAISNENNGNVFTIRILQDGTGSRTVTWFSTIKWAGGSAPTLTATANKADTVIFRVTGTDTYDGFVVGKNV